jgi:hypothetical protein
VGSLIAGGVFALLQFLFHYLIDDRSVGRSLLSAALSGLFFGPVFGALTYRTAQRQRAAMGTLPDRESRLARRAATRGPVPADPQVRDAALRVANFRLDQAKRQLVWGSLFWAVIIAIGMWLVMTDSPWWAVPVMLFAGLLIFQLRLPGHLRRRVALLQHQGSASGNTPR